MSLKVFGILSVIDLEEEIVRGFEKKLNKPLPGKLELFKAVSLFERSLNVNIES